MNLKRELQKMNISDLRSVCNELGVSCSKNKKSIIKMLLLPLKRVYKKNTSGESKKRKVINPPTGPIKKRKVIDPVDGRSKKRKVINPSTGPIKKSFIIYPVKESDNSLIPPEEIDDIFNTDDLIRIAYYEDFPYICKRCKLGYRGASGLWYHNVKTHGQKKKRKLSKKNVKPN